MFDLCFIVVVSCLLARYWWPRLGDIFWRGMMCTEVILDDREIATCSELAELFGCELTDLVGDVGEDDGPTCLCGVDIAASAAKFGYTAKQDWKTYCGDWVLKKLVLTEFMAKHMKRRHPPT